MLRILAGRSCRCVLLGVCLAPAAAGAEVVPWLYDVQVPVRSQTAAERQRAGRIALRELLTRLTGLERLPDHAEIGAALRAPERFFVRYRFARREVPAGADESFVAELFDVSFQSGDVLSLLRRADLPVWSANRPSIVLWLVAERGAERALVAADDDLAAALQERARRRGLQLRLPLMDLDDFAIEAADVWGGFTPRIAGASARYAPQLLLLGRAAQGAAGRWSTDWDMRVAGGRPMPLGGRFVKQGNDLAAAAGWAVDRVADRLAERFAVRGDLDAIPVTVYGAGSVLDYAALLRHLQSREYIERVVVDVARAGALELRLHVRSGRDQLVDLLALGDRFAVEAAGSPAFELAPLRLTWRGGG